MSERHKEWESRSDAIADELVKRISLWLAAGNAAGFAGAANKALDNAAVANAHLLVPACWSFALGLIAAFWMNCVMMMSHRAMSKYYAATGIDEERLHKSEADTNSGCMAILLVMAGLAFMFGLFYPLTAISLRG